MTDTQKKFIEKFNAIYNDYKAANRAYSSIKDPIESKRTEQKATWNNRKLTELFKKLVNALPEEQMTLLHSSLEGQYKAMIGEERYNKFVLPSLTPPRYPTPESRKYHLFYSIPDALINNGAVCDIALSAVEHIDENMLEGMMSESDKFQSDVIDNIKVEFFRNRVEQLKKINEGRINDKEQLKELNEELENVAKTVITSTAGYGSAQGDVYDGIYRHIAEDRIDELNEKLLSTSEYKHFREYFDAESLGKYRGNRVISVEHVEDTNIPQLFTGDNVKMTFDDKTKNSMRKVFDYMRSHNMFRDNSNMGEQEIKIYGFAAICEAHDKLEKAIEGIDVAAIREARAQYETELENMRGLYALIKQEFNPTPEMMIGNVLTYRTLKVPNEFKNDILLNALVSGFFNLNAALAQQNSNLEQMFENPAKVFLDIVKGFSKGMTADAILKDQNVAQAIKTLTIAASEKFPAYGLGRNMEFLQAITYGSDSFEKNSLGTMLFASYASHVGNIVFDTDGNSVTPKNYLRVNTVETLANILLVNDEDRDYNKLRAFESLSIDCSEKIPAFDTMKYLETHTIDAGALIDRFKATVTELYEQDYFQRDAGATKNTAIADTIRAAQFAAYQFLLVNPIPTDDANSKDWDALKEIVENPEAVFAEKIDEKTKEALDKRPPKHKMFESEIKAKIDAARIAERKAEQEYNDKARDLINKFAKLSEQFGTGIGAEADAVRADYTNAKNELASLQVKEFDRLREAFNKGYMPTSYYEQRKRDINTRRIDHFVPFGADEAMAIARDEARKAEKAYEKNVSSLIKQVNNLSKKVGKGDDKAEQQYAQAQTKLNELKEAELKRLDKAYADGKLTQSYYDERRFNVETDNLKKIVPFGVNEAPTQKQFKAQYKNELKRNELGEDEVQMLYDRMMQRMRLDDFKFKQVAMGESPKPEQQVSELASKTVDHEKVGVRMCIPEANEETIIAKSPMVAVENEKIVDKQITN